MFDYKKKKFSYRLLQLIQQSQTHPTNIYNKKKKEDKCVFSTERTSSRANKLMTDEYHKNTNISTQFLFSNGILVGGGVLGREFLCPILYTMRFPIVTIP